MAMSENSINIINYLKGQAGKNLTSHQVAADLGLDRKTVDGAFTSLVKKGLGVRVDGEVKGTAEVKYLALTDAGKAVDTTDFSDNAKAIVAHFCAKPAAITLNDLADATGIDAKAINGSFNSLVKKGLAERTVGTVDAMVPVKYLALTDAGMAWTGDEADA